jgi:hypothetical protein
MSHHQRSWLMLLLLTTTGGALLVAALPQRARADGITGRVQLTFAHSQSRSRDLTRPFLPIIDSEARAFLQQYQLNLDRSFYPNLRLYATGLFQKTDYDSFLNEEHTSGSTTLTRPYIDLSLRTPIYMLGANYNKATTETKSDVGPGIATISEAYTGILGWKPVGLPTLDLRLSRSNNYDRDREIRDTVTDQVILYSNYDASRAVRLRYEGNYLDTRDNIRDYDTQSTGHTGKINFADQFFKNRLAISGYYNYGHRTTEFTSSGQGTVDFPLLAVDGLLASSDIPLTVRLNSAPFLIDNTRTGPQNSTNNIGSDTYPLDITARNVGLQLSAPAELNALAVSVYSLSGATLATAVPAYLPAAVAGSLTWAVYTSSDNQTWSLHQSGAAAPYEIDPTSFGVGTFSIAFPNVTTRYIKVVVSPLSPFAAGGQGGDYPGVYVTELQAFLTVPAADVAKKTTSTTQLANINTKVRIIQTPSSSLDYDFTYYSNRAESQSSTSQSSTTRTSSLVNALTLGHRFSAVFSGNASVSRADDNDPSGTTVRHDFNAQVMAVPLRTLSHSIGYSANTRQEPNGQRTTGEALYLSNTAELYRNITAFLNGGASTTTAGMGLKTDTTNYIWGVNLIPRQTLNITVSSSVLRSEQSGGGGQETWTRLRSSNASIAYYPVSLLYLYASWQKNVTYERSETINNYGLNWSPFPGGNLQLTYAYNETLMSQDNSVDKSSSPALRWYIARGAFIVAAYVSSTNESDKLESTSRSYNASLNVAL